MHLGLTISTIALQLFCARDLMTSVQCYIPRHRGSVIICADRAYRARLCGSSVARTGTRRCKCADQELVQRRAWGHSQERRAMGLLWLILGAPFRLQARALGRLFAALLFSCALAAAGAAVLFFFSFCVSIAETMSLSVSLRACSRRRFRTRRHGCSTVA